jgi:hypothetical protein
MIGVDIPIEPDAHEAGITEPVQPMFDAMIVDIREYPGSSNFYFYQHPTGKIIFCLTPAPQIWETSPKIQALFAPVLQATGGAHAYPLEHSSSQNMEGNLPHDARWKSNHRQNQWH